MKVIAFLLIAFMLCISAFNLSANNRLNSISDKNYSSNFKFANDSSKVGIKGKTMIAVGVGLNFFGSTLQKEYFKSNNYSFIGNIEDYNASPMYNVMVDYGLYKKVSVGIAFGYQKVEIKLKEIDNTEDKYFDSWQRLHFAARWNYYLIAKEDRSVYTGIKVGYNVYTVTSDVPESLYPGYIKNLDVSPFKGSFQAHLGFRYYIKMVGFNAEAGLGYGGPYVFAAGITVKI